MTISQERLANFNEISKHFKLGDNLQVLNIGSFEIDFCENDHVSKDNPALLSDIHLIFINIVEHGFVYRLKPQPKYVPFEKWEEVFENAYNPWALWVKYRDAPHLISGISEVHTVKVNDLWGNFETAFKELVFYNPETKQTKPFGKLKK